MLPGIRVYDLTKVLPRRSMRGDEHTGALGHAQRYVAHGGDVGLRPRGIPRALIVEGDRPSPFGVVAVVFISFSISPADERPLSACPRLASSSLLVFYVIVRVDFFTTCAVDFTWVDKLFLDTSDR